MAKKALKIVLIILGVIALAAAALVLWLSLTEYKPEDVTVVKVAESSDLESRQPAIGDEISVVSWNIGYAGLGKGSDFFMDGGTNVSSADKDTVSSYLDGIYNTL